MPSSQWAPGLTPVALSVWFFRVEKFCDVATISRNFSVIKFTNHRQCDNSDLLPLVRLLRFHVQNSGLGFGRPLEFEFQKITRHDSRQLIFHCLCRCLLAPNLLKRFSVCQWWMVNGEFIRFNVIEVSNQLSILVMITLCIRCAISRLFPQFRETFHVLSHLYSKKLNNCFKEWRFQSGSYGIAILLFPNNKSVSAGREKCRQFKDNRKERGLFCLLSFCCLIGGAEPLSQNFPPLYDPPRARDNVSLIFVLGQRRLSRGSP